MPTITLLGSFERLYAVSALGEALAKPSVVGLHYPIGPGRSYYIPKQTEDAEARAQADDDTEVLITSEWSGDPDSVLGWRKVYHLSPRPRGSPNSPLRILLTGFENLFKVEVIGAVGDSRPVYLENIVIGAPPLIVPTNHALVLVFNDTYTDTISLHCSTCECSHAEAHLCPGPPLK